MGRPHEDVQNGRKIIGDGRDGRDGGVAKRIPTGCGLTAAINPLSRQLLHPPMPPPSPNPKRLASQAKSDNTKDASHVGRKQARPGRGESRPRPGTAR